MTQTKVRKIKGRKRDPVNQPIHSQVSWILSWMAVVIMFILGIRHFMGIGYEASWSKYALLQSILGLVGLVSTQIIREQPLKIQHYRSVDLNTGFYVIITLTFAMLSQIVTQYVFTISNTEQALYYVFSAVCEELFFRLFLINFFLMFGRETYMKITAVVLESIAFAAFHQNYYNNLGMLVGVFLGGVIFGMVYIWKDDISIVILAHFALNLIATGNWLVNL